jgi:hypothetical protein
MRASYIRQIARPFGVPAPQLTPSRRWPLRTGEERPPAIPTVAEPFAVAPLLPPPTVSVPHERQDAAPPQPMPSMPPPVVATEIEPSAVDGKTTPTDEPPSTARAPDMKPELTVASPAPDETQPPAPVIADSVAPLSAAPPRLQRKSAPQRQAPSAHTATPWPIRVATPVAKPPAAERPLPPTDGTAALVPSDSTAVPPPIAPQHRPAAKPAAPSIPSSPARAEPPAAEAVHIPASPPAIAPQQQRAPALPPRLRPAEPAGTTVRIGTIEVKVAPPPAPPSPASPPSPPARAAPQPALSRGFASPFGLRQG